MGALVLNTVKEAEESAQPLLLVDITLPDASVLHLATHDLVVDGVTYEARVLDHQIAAIQALSQQGVDVPANVAVPLADADKAMSQVDQEVGFRGARMKLTFLFCDLATGQLSDKVIPFIGRCGDPDITEDVCTVAAEFILNLESKYIPSFPIQKKCPKPFPDTPDKWAQVDNKESIYFDCGVAGFSSCTLTRGGCHQLDRFGGHVYELAPGARTRSFMTGDWLSLVSDNNIAKYGDYAPEGYGQAWVECLVLHTFPEANSTRGEAIICRGRPVRILRVLVNDEEIPPTNDLYGSTYKPKDPLFRYTIISTGDRSGALNMDVPWNGQGDPHGSLCTISWVVYRDVAPSTPRVRALVEFPKVQKYVKIASVTSGVVTFANNVANREVASNEPNAVRIIGNSNPALNASWGLSDWQWGPPGQVTLTGTTESGTGGYIVYLGASQDYAWAIRDVLSKAGLREADTDIDAFCRASEKFVSEVPFTTSHYVQYASGVVYAVGEVVSYGIKFWRSKQNDNQGHLPDEGDSDWWEETANGGTAIGVASQHAKFECSLAIRTRRSIADVLNGMLRGCAAHIGRNLTTGQIGLFPRESIAEQQPAAVDGSNDNTPVEGGYLAYHFHEKDILRFNGLSTFRQIGRPLGAVPNAVAIGFSDEENDYATDSLQVIDAEDINLVEQPIGGSYPVDGCNALDRANRVGSIFLSELVGGYPYQWQTSAKYVKGLVGQIIGVTNPKYGLDRQLMRVRQIVPTTNWQTMMVEATFHRDSWYAKDLSMIGQSSSGPRRQPLDRRPWEWCPYYEQPHVDDPVYDESEWTFGMVIAWEVLRNGDLQISVIVTGAITINQPGNIQAPGIKQQGLVGTGGTITGGTVYWAAVCGRDSHGLPGPVSWLCQIAIAAAGSGFSVTIPMRYWDLAGDGWYVFAGRQPGSLSYAGDAETGRPGSITLLSIPESTWGPPDVLFDHLVVKTHLVEHYGPFAVTLTGAATGKLTVVEAGWTVDQWKDYDCSILHKADGSPLKVLNFRVSSNTVDELTVTPDPVARGVAAGDLLAMLSKPTITGLTVEDPNWENSLAGGGLGLTPGAEVNRILRIFAGAGRGYAYPIASNTETTVTIVGPWVVTPDSTSRYVIEAAGELPSRAVSPPQANADYTAQISIPVPVTNYAGRVLLVEVATADRRGIESTPSLNPLRAIYIAGGQGTRAVTANDTQRLTDGLLLFNCFAGDITYQCLPQAVVPNINLMLQKVINVPADGNIVTVLPAAGEAFADGSTSITLTDANHIVEMKFHG